MASFLILLVQTVVWVITVVLILNALMSFAPLEPWHPVRRFLHDLAEPIVQPFRRLIPPVGMFDFSIMIALIVIQLLGRIVIVLIVSAFS